MFKALISFLLFLSTIAIVVYICQDFEPHYLIMIIPMTLFMGAVAFTNIKAFVDDVIRRNQNKKNNIEE